MIMDPKYKELIPALEEAGELNKHEIEAFGPYTC